MGIILGTNFGSLEDNCKVNFGTNFGHGQVVDANEALEVEIRCHIAIIEEVDFVVGHIVLDFFILCIIPTW